MNTEKIIVIFKKIHGDKYDYSKVVWVNNTSKVIIICKNHGEFLQRPKNHKTKRGCIKCFHNKLFDTTSTFIKKADEIHGNKYDYSKVEYINSRSNVTIICKEHGSFSQKAANHINGSGCHKCFSESMKIKISLTNDQFIERSKKLYPSKFDYTNTKYISVAANINLKCIEHDLEFETNTTSHLRLRSINGGCPTCVYNHLSSIRSKDPEQFLEECKKTHGNRYNYSKVEYKGDNKKIIIICNVHGEFKQQAGIHSRGQGCPRCNIYKNKNECKNIIEKLTGYDFIKERPRFLNRLEYDGYNDELKLAFEYNGEQHYNYISFFYSGKKSNFKKQKQNDLKKKELSHKNGIYLITIPCYIEDKKSYISNEYEKYELMNICS